MAKAYQSIWRFGFIGVSVVLVVLLTHQLLNLRTLVSPVAKLKPSSGFTILTPPPVQLSAVQNIKPVQTQKPTQTATKPAPKTSSLAAVVTIDIASLSICTNQDQISQAAAVIGCMTNYARKFHNIAAVAGNSILAQAAAAKAGDIVSCNDFSHTACGRTSNYWVTTKGYPGNCSAENIARGQTTPGQVFGAWMNSSGHRANILGPSYTDLGTAELSSSMGPVWVMEFGGC